MKKNLSTRIKCSLSRIKALYIFITDVYLSLDSEFIVNYIESKNIVIILIGGIKIRLKISIFYGEKVVHLADF